MANKVFMIGNITKDIELSETPNGIAVCRFSIAINSGYGEDKRTDYFNIVTWRNQAEVCGKYLKKGSKVAIVGSIQNRTFDDKEGNKRTVTEIVASEVEFLSLKRNEEESTISDEEDSNSPF